MFYISRFNGNWCLPKKKALKKNDHLLLVLISEKIVTQYVIIIHANIKHKQETKMQ